MRQENETREKLLGAAKKEFLELGYEKASLRNICRLSGVTTGALYFFFKDKNDLFASLVKKVADEIIDFIKEHTEKEKELHADKEISRGEVSQDGILQGREFVTYMYRNREVCILLLSKATGSSYEKFFDDIVELMAEDTKKFVVEILGESKNTNLNPYTLHWLSHLETSSYAQLLLHDLTLEEALMQSDIIARYLSAGWFELLQ